jgi:hypothetical protein
MADNDESIQNRSDEPEPQVEVGAGEANSPASEGESTGTSNSDSIRQQILSEIQEEEALEEFRQTRPDMWVQVLRIGRLLELQEDLEEEIWPEGSCFLHANTSAFQSFCVRKVLDVDLETCTVAVSIYGDEELEEGTVLLPLENLSWIGFPKNAVTVGRRRFRGFTAILGGES